MSNCGGKNLSDIDLQYAKKILTEEKNWAWWLNNIG